MSSSDNPFEVESIKDFLFFCCPTCDKKICGQKRDAFLQHAFSQHPESKQCLEELIASEHNDEEFEDKNHEFEGVNEKMDSDEIKPYNHDVTNFIAVKEEPGDYNLTHYDEYNKAEIEEKIVDSSEKNSENIMVSCEIDEDEINSATLSTKKKFPCHLCNKKLGCKNSLNTHILSIHEGQKIHKCDECGKFFAQNSNLKTHILTRHQGIKPVCKFCGKSYVTDNYLRKHISAVHKGSKNYMCKFCSKTYSHKEGLNNHISTVHEGIKYQCYFCEKSFTQSNNLKRHAAKQHEEISYSVPEDQKCFKCDSCGKSFTEARHFKLHIHMVHNGQKDTKVLPIS